MTDGSYRQKRCPHGWTGDQCPECIKLAAKDAEIERLRAALEFYAAEHIDDGVNARTALLGHPLDL